MLRKTKTQSYLAALTTVFFWASSFPAVKYSLRYYSPESVMLFRFLVASLVLILYCFVTKTRFPEKRDLPLLTITGVVGIFAYMWLFNTGTSMVDAGISSFIIASAPIFALLLGIVFLKEKSGFLCWAGILISSLGLLLITTAQNSRFEINRGVFLLMLAAVSAALYTILQRKLVQKYSSIQVTALAIIFATIPMLLFLPQLVAEFPHAPLSAQFVIVYLGIFPAAAAYFLWGYALSKAEKTIHVTSFLYLSPFLATLMSYFWLHEAVSFISFVGGILIISGMIVMNFKKEASS